MNGRLSELTIIISIDYITVPVATVIITPTVKFVPLWTNIYYLLFNKTAINNKIRVTRLIGQISIDVNSLIKVTIKN
jgi:hypothetical protein